MPRPVLTLKRYDRMKRMIKGSDDDVQLIVNIVNECNIEESLLYILALIPHKYEEMMVFCTPLMRSKNLHDFLTKRAISVHYNLDILVGIWQTHCEEKGINPTQGQKFLASEYIAPPRNTFSRSKLNPKKKGR